jgi:hypothetical protein
LSGFRNAGFGNPILLEPARYGLQTVCPLQLVLPTPSA